MKTKKDMAALAAETGMAESTPRLSEKQSSEKPQVKTKQRRTNAEIASARAQEVYGNKGDFIKFTCTLDPVTYKWLQSVTIERKINGEKNMSPSVIIREALVARMQEKA